MGCVRERLGQDRRRRRRSMKFSTSWPFVRTAIDEEIEHHMLERAENLAARGYSPTRARREAERRFGDIGRVRRSMLRVHQAADRGERFMEFVQSFLRDVLHGVRLARTAPGFALALVLTIGVGVGANTALFSVTDAVLLRPLPYEAPEELVSIGTYYPEQGWTSPWLPTERALALQRVGLGFDGLVMISQASFVDTGAEIPMGFSARVVSSQWTEVLGTSPQLGRPFTEADALPGSPPVVALSDATWRTRYGADPAIVGTVIQFDHRDYTIVSVMPPGFKFPPTWRADGWVPLRTDGTVDGPVDGAAGGVQPLRSFQLVGRLAPGDTIARARERIAAIATAMPRTSAESEDWQAGVVSFGQFRAASDVERALWVLTAVAAVMLAIATVNAANLILARAMARRGELATRMALGASRARLVRQTLAEALVLVGAGGVLALLLARAALGTLVGLLPSAVTFRLASEIAIDTRVLAFALATTTVAGIGMSVVPALRITSAARAALGRNDTIGRSAVWKRHVLLVSQVAMTMTLLAMAGLVTSSFLRLTAVDPGYNPAGLIQMSLSLPSVGYPDTATRRAFFDSLVDRIAALPTVTSVTLADGLPPDSGFANGVELEAEGVTSRAFPDTLLPFATVDTEFFATFETDIVAGRSFTEEDADQPDNVIIDRTLASFLWSAENPIGRRFRVHSGRGPWLTVVGLVGDLKLLGQDDRSGTMDIFYPLQRGRAGSYMALVIRSTGEPLALIPELRGLVRALDADLPIYELTTATGALAEANDKPRFFLLLMSLFAGMSLMLALVGIYSTLAFSVRQRRRELGIRGALGARAPQLQALVLRQGLRLVAAGITIGLLGALALGAVARSLLFNTEPTDPLTLTTVAVVMLLSAAVACWIPARRATRVDPVEVLRAD